MSPNRCWRQVTLESLPISVTGGVSVPCDNRSARQGEPAVLKLSALNAGRFEPTENKAVHHPHTLRLGDHVQADTILISRSNTEDLVGSSVYVAKEYPQLFLPDLIWSINVTDRRRLSAEWLSVALGTTTSRRQIKSLASGTSGSMKKLSVKRLGQLRILLPPVGEQERIARFVRTLTNAQWQVDALVRTKRIMKRGLMEALLSGRQRLPEFTEDWKRYRLGALFQERIETDRADLPLLSITADRGVVPREEIDRRDTSNPDKRAYLRIAPGDIGYNSMRMWQGVSALSELEGIVSPAYTICTPTSEIDGRFAATLFKHAPVVHLFRRYSQGLVDDTLSLKFHDFAQICVQIPGLREQKAIARIFSLIDDELAGLRRLLQLLEVQRRALVDKLLSGEIPIPAS